jgi:hypothetical protein
MYQMANRGDEREHYPRDVRAGELLDEVAEQVPEGGGAAAGPCRVGEDERPAAYGAKAFAESGLNVGVRRTGGNELPAEFHEGHCHQEQRDDGDYKDKAD